MPLGRDGLQQGLPPARLWVPLGHALLDPAEMMGGIKRGELWKWRDLDCTPKAYANLDQILKIYL